MNLKHYIFWKKHRRDSFTKQLFEDVYIEDEQLKESIVDWITRLNNRNIKIDKFTSLFNKFDKIVFPIKVSGHPCKLLIIDANENHYYLLYNQYLNSPEYSIGKLTKCFYTEFTYWLSRESGISLDSFEVLQLDETGNQTNNKVTFNYHSEISSTTVILHIQSEKQIRKLEISYQSLDFEHDNRIWKDLLDLCPKSYNEDTLLIKIQEILKSKSILTLTYSTTNFIKS